MTHKHGTNGTDTIVDWNKHHSTTLEHQVPTRQAGKTPPYQEAGLKAQLPLVLLPDVESLKEAEVEKRTSHFPLLASCMTATTFPHVTQCKGQTG